MDAWLLAVSDLCAFSPRMVNIHSTQPCSSLPLHPCNVQLIRDCSMLLAGSRADHDTEKLEQFVEACLEAGHAEDAVLAGDSAQTANVWSIREGISESLQKHGEHSCGVSWIQPLGGNKRIYLIAHGPRMHCGGSPTH